VRFSNVASPHPERASHTATPRAIRARARADRSRASLHRHTARFSHRRMSDRPRSAHSCIPPFSKVLPTLPANSVVSSLWRSPSVNVLPSVGRDVMRLQPVAASIPARRPTAFNRASQARPPPWKDGFRAAEAQFGGRRGEYAAEEWDLIGRLGAQPTMGSSSGSLTASRDENFPNFQLSHTTSLEIIEHRRMNQAWTPLGSRFGSIATSSYMNKPPRVFSSLPSPRAATPHEQREQAVTQLSRGVGVLYAKPPLWTARPSNSLAGICI
jgi:hypothetical protein